MWKAPTTLQAGALGDHTAVERDQMFVNPSTCLSLRGVYNPNNGRERKGEDFSHAGRVLHHTRAAIDMGDAAIKRTRG